MVDPFGSLDMREYKERVGLLEIVDNLCNV